MAIEGLVRRGRSRWISAAAVATLLAVGCSAGKTGPTSAPSVGDTAAAVSRSAPSTTAAPPSSPRDINAAGIDPCMLLRDPAQPDLNIDGASPSSEGAFNGATCEYSTTGQVQYAVTATDGFTLDHFRSAVQSRQNSSSDTAGFPTVSSYDPSRPKNCTTAIGTSATGMIVVTAKDMQASAKDKDGLCQTTRHVAAAALEGLKSQQ